MSAARARYRFVVCVALAVACGYHDTPVATYHAPVTKPVGAAGSGGSGGDGNEATAGEAGAAAPSVPACAPTYPTSVPGLTSLYRQGATSQIWPVAERDCESDGGHLIVIDDDAENRWLESLAVKAVTDDPSSNQLMWLGLGDQATEGQFLWVTGRPVELAYWRGGEPNSLNGFEDCGEILGNGQWNDDRCNAKLTYICECDGAVSAGLWCDTDTTETCGDCSTACAMDQTCTAQLCK